MTPHVVHCYTCGHRLAPIPRRKDAVVRECRCHERWLIKVTPTGLKVTYIGHARYQDS